MADQEKSMIEFDPGNGVVRIIGEMDYTVANDFRNQLHEHMRKCACDVTIDLSKVEYMDSSGLAVLIEARRILSESGHTLSLRNLTPQVEKVIRLTQVGELFGLNL